MNLVVGDMALCQSARYIMQLFVYKQRGPAKGRALHRGRFMTPAHRLCLFLAAVMAYASLPVVAADTGNGATKNGGVKNESSLFAPELEWLASLGNAEGMGEWTNDSEAARILAGRLRNDHA